MRAGVCVSEGLQFACFINKSLKVGLKVILSFEHKRANFFVATVSKLSQEDVVQISWQFTVKMLTK